jgi:hypothetical protein
MYALKVALQMVIGIAGLALLISGGDWG